MAELSKQKAKTWKAFSAFIRTRDCLEWMKSNPEVNELMGACVTCGRVYPYKSLQAGHFCPSRRNSILFDEENCHIQDYGCNCGRNGNVIRYYPFMLKKYGQKTIDRIMALHDTERKFDVDELKTMEKDYIRRTEDLLGSM